MSGLLRSLRLRLLLLSLLVILAALSLFAWQLSHMFEQHVERRLFRELDNHMGQILANLTRTPSGRITLSRPLSDPRFSRPYSGLYWQLDGSRGPLARSRSLWDYALPVDISMPARGRVHEYTLKGPENRPLFAIIRAVWLDLGDGEKRYVLTVAQDHGEITAAVTEFRSDLYVALALLLVALVIAHLVQVWLGLKPLDAIRRQLQRIRAGRQKRLVDGHVTELAPLVEELNALLDARERDVERARSRAADLAHGLKTPLAILAARARSLARAGETAAARDIDRQIAVLRRHVEHELARAKIHGPGAGRAVTTPLAAQIGVIAQALSGMRAGNPVEWHIDIPEDLLVPMERGDLLELAGNLLENACKWAHRHVAVIGGRGAGGHIFMRVEDDGPGVPDDKLDEILQRGRRLDESVQGTGLGMAIVRDVVESYGYDLRLGRAALGGLAVTVVFSPQATGDGRADKAAARV